jgi:hypothetical protein
MADITIKRGKTVEHIYSAPNSVLDVSIGALKKAGMQGLLAVAVTSVALKLYTHGKADLGYGLVATITGQNGPHSRT